MTSREIIKRLKDDGWYEVGAKGDHFHFEHATKLGKVTVPHPQKDVKIKTLISIERQSGVKMR